MESERAKIDNDLIEELMTALHDAINRPKGVVPDSAMMFYEPYRCMDNCDHVNKIKWYPCSGEHLYCPDCGWHRYRGKDFSKEEWSEWIEGGFYECERSG